MIENSVLFQDLQKISSARVLCIGDVMMDKFVYGAVERISPEAPIPVFLVQREKHMLGGAGNVVANIAALGASSALIAVVGDDAAGADIQKQLEASGIEAGLEIAKDRFTTVKSRFIGSGQQMLRVDREKSVGIPLDVEDRVIARAQKMIPNAGIVVLSDYKKGILTDRVVSEVIACAQLHKVPVIVDPKGQDFTRYKGATLITPNRKELEAATGHKAGTDAEVRAAAYKVIMDCGIQTVLVTRSQDGMSIIAADLDPVHFPANVREIFDVSGAGDTVIATLSSCLAAGVPLRHAALIANIAAGIVVGKAGTATARVEEILQAIEDGTAHEKRTATRVKENSIPAAAEQAERWRARGFKVGFTNGCFDLLHPGHLSSLRQAKAACDYLIVAINSDNSVKKLKGPTRPVQDQVARAAILSALEMVDMVVVFDAETPIEIIKAVKPDVLVKGGQYKLEEVVGYDVVMSYGGKIVRADMEDGFSTTNTISKMSA